MVFVACCVAVLAVVTCCALTLRETIQAQRSYVLERQNLSPEDGRYTLPEYRAFMLAIAQDSAADPLGNKATLEVFDKHLILPHVNGASTSAGPASILEVGPGSGAFARLLASKFPNASVVGIDASRFSIDVAKHSAEMPANLRFELRSSAELVEPPKSVDIVTTNFVNHEIFPDASFVEFLRRVSLVGRSAFIFNDYVRSPGCILGTSFLRRIAGYGQDLPGVEAWLPGDLQARAAVLLSQAPAVQQLLLDGALQSMRRSFTLGEYEALFKEAGYPEGSLKCSSGVGSSWQDFLGTRCRIACRADLTFRND